MKSLLNFRLLLCFTSIFFNSCAAGANPYSNPAGHIYYLMSAKPVDKRLAVEKLINMRSSGWKSFLICSATVAVASCLLAQGVKAAKRIELFSSSVPKKLDSWAILASSDNSKKDSDDNFHPGITAKEPKDEENFTSPDIKCTDDHLDIVISGSDRYERKLEKGESRCSHFLRFRISRIMNKISLETDTITTRGMIEVIDNMSTTRKKKRPEPEKTTRRHVEQCLKSIEARDSRNQVFIRYVLGRPRQMGYGVIPKGEDISVYLSKQFEKVAGVPLDLVCKDRDWIKSAVLSFDLSDVHITGEYPKLDKACESGLDSFEYNVVADLDPIDADELDALLLEEFRDRFRKSEENYGLGPIEIYDAP